MTSKECNFNVNELLLHYCSTVPQPYDHFETLNRLVDEMEGNALIVSRLSQYLHNIFENELIFSHLTFHSIPLNIPL